MIDHTRAFRKWDALRNPAAVTWCPPDLFYSLQALHREDLDRDLLGILTDEQISALITRRDLILAKLTTQP
jgi:hypothetical protein